LETWALETAGSGEVEEAEAEAEEASGAQEAETLEVVLLETAAQKTG